MLLLQPRVVMVVVIASNGGVDEARLHLRAPVDPGLVEWASSYLNERLPGLGLGARMIADRLADPELGEPRAAFLAEIGDAFTELEERAEADSTWTARAAALRGATPPTCPMSTALMRALERRVSVLLGSCASALDERSVFVWIGDENPAPELRSVSVVGANYGLGYRNLGHGRRARAAAHGLRDGDRLGA